MMGDGYYGLCMVIARVYKARGPKARGVYDKGNKILITRHTPCQHLDPCQTPVSTRNLTRYKCDTVRSVLGNKYNY